MNLAADHVREVLLALRGVRRPVEVVDEQQRVREVAEREARVRVRQLVVHDARCERIQVRAAIGFRNRDPDQAEVAELAQEARVERAFLVVLHRLRFDTCRGELANGLPQQAMLFGLTHHHRVNLTRRMWPTVR